MGADDDLLIRDLTAADVRAAVALATAAGFRDRCKRPGRLARRDRG